MMNRLGHISNTPVGNAFIAGILTMATLIMVIDTIDPKISWKKFKALEGTFMEEGLLYHVDPADVPNPSQYYIMGGDYK